MKDQQIIAQIRKGRREKPIRTLYKEFPKIKNNIISNGGDEVIAKEIFHDSLILLIEKVSDPKFELTSKLSTFLYGINHFLWKNELRKRRKNPEVEWRDSANFTDQDLGYNSEKEEQLKLLETVLDSVSEKCKAIFELFYVKNLSMKVIAEKLGFSSVNSAKTQKYKCVEKASQLASQSSVALENANPKNVVK